MTSVSTLYTRDILRLASSLPVDGRLSAPDGEAERRSQTCGSVVRASVMLADGRVVQAALEAHSCALGQASAAIALAHAAGMTLTQITAVRDALVAALAGRGEWPDQWPELALLEPARAFPARHAALILPFDALLAAIEDAG